MADAAELGGSPQKSLTNLSLQDAELDATNASTVEGVQEETEVERIARLNSIQLSIGQNQNQMDAEIFKCDGKEIDFDFQNVDLDRVGVRKLMQSAEGRGERQN